MGLYGRHVVEGICDTYDPYSTRPTCQKDMECIHCGYNRLDHEEKAKKKMKDELPTAEEAARIVMGAQYEKAQEQLAKATRTILNAIRHGQRSTTIDGSLDAAVVAQLKAKGYSVVHGNDRNETYCSITW